MRASEKPQQSRERGVTLIELMTVMITLLALAGISIQAFKGYREMAAYAVAQQTLKDARTSIDAALSDSDKVYSAVSSAVLSAPGIPTNPQVFAVMPGFRMPRNAKLTVSYAPSCLSAACEVASLEVRPCKGAKYTSWVRYGDGTELLLGDMAGAGCP